MKFKVGDRVKFIGECSFLRRGVEGVITSVDYSHWITYVVDFERGDDDAWDCSEHELELAQ